MTYDNYIKQREELESKIAKAEGCKRIFLKQDLLKLDKYYYKLTML